MLIERQLIAIPRRIAHPGTPQHLQRFGHIGTRRSLTKVILGSQG
jgi:hypothetical protein